MTALSETVGVRLAHADDAAALATLHATCFARPWDVQTISQFVDVPGCLVLIASRSLDEAQGFLILRAAADEAEILTLCVLAAQRRRGIARALVAEAMRLLRAAGTKVLFLEVDAENKEALALYRALGARKVGERASYYEGGADAAIFSLALCGSDSEDAG